MKNVARLVFSFGLILAGSAQAAWPANAEPFARAVLLPRSGSQASGTVDFAKTDQGLLIRAYVTNVSPGAHGFHVHEKDDCSAPDASSAGEHFNPTDQPHGGPKGQSRHAGDFGNLIVKADSSAPVEMTIPSPTRAFDWKMIVGKALVLHDKADDLKSQPSGKSGDRIACGVIEAIEKVAE